MHAQYVRIHTKTNKHAHTQTNKHAHTHTQTNKHACAHAYSAVDPPPEELAEAQSLRDNSWEEVAGAGKNTANSVSGTSAKLNTASKAGGSGSGRVGMEMLGVCVWCVCVCVCVSVCVCACVCARCVWTCQVCRSLGRGKVCGCHVCGC